jgi:hypothetical protein
VDGSLSTHSTPESKIHWFTYGHIFQTDTREDIGIRRSESTTPWSGLLNARSISDPETSTTEWTRGARTKTVSNKTNKNDLSDAIREAIRNVEALRNLEDGWADEDSIAPTEAAIGDALQFLAKLPQETLKPQIFAAADGEIVIEWRFGGKEAVVGIDGDGTFGYTLFLIGRFEPGKEDGLISKDELPCDLATYILDIKK